MKNGSKKKKNHLPGQTTFGEEVVNSFRDFSVRAGHGEAITMRTVALDMRVHAYSLRQVQHLRRSPNISQALFAKFLGVSIPTMQSWEQGTQKPSHLACRFLDEIAGSPDYWKQRLAHAMLNHN